MKCLVCGEKTDDSILCGKHSGIDIPLQYLSVHTCSSFKQKKGEIDGVCEYCFLCAPIKKALKREVLMGNLGHVICPHASMNLDKVAYSKFTGEDLKRNYEECL